MVIDINAPAMVRTIQLPLKQDRHMNLALYIPHKS